MDSLEDKRYAAKRSSSNSSVNNIQSFSGSSISYEDDEFEVTRFINDQSINSEEFFPFDTPVKHIGSESGQKIVLGAKDDFNEIPVFGIFKDVLKANKQSILLNRLDLPFEENSFA